jgi:ATP-dependent Lhr-like helicase
VLDVLWDLFWAGEVTNDAPSALRAFLFARAPRRAPQRRRAAAFRSRRDAPPSGAGRFSLLRGPRAAKPPSATERMAALAEQLLARHGVLTRDAVAAEAVPGGFAAIYPVLRAMEEAGRIRRGYFVSGLGASQFADPGALERLRALRETAATPEQQDAGERPAVVLAATDPANPYGAALPWPSESGVPFMRAAGLHLVLVDGRLAALVGRGAGTVHVLLPPEEPLRSQVGRAAALSLARWALAQALPALGWSAEGAPPLSRGPLAPFLREAGLEPTGPGFRLGLRAPHAGEPGSAGGEAP